MHMQVLRRMVRSGLKGINNPIGMTPLTLATTMHAQLYNVLLQAT